MLEPLPDEDDPIAEELPEIGHRPQQAIDARSDTSGPRSPRELERDQIELLWLEAAQLDEPLELREAEAVEVSCQAAVVLGADNLIERLEPTGNARFVEFTTLLDPRQMPGQRDPILKWPYVDGLRIDEALHPLTLIAVEYITHKGPASLEGHLFNFTGAPNRYGLPPFYEIHAWIWKHNPDGMFKDWNPDGTCGR